MTWSARSAFTAAVPAIMLLWFGPEGSASSPSGVTVVVVTPGAERASSNEMSFSISLGESTIDSLDELLRGLAQAGGEELAILVRDDVPIRNVLTVVSLSSKAGYSRYHVLVFDPERRGMALVPDFKWVDFSKEPADVSELVRRSEKAK